MSAADQITVLNSGNKYLTEINSGNHKIISDEPVEFGGEDSGFSPYELLLSALGACKAITMRMFAQRKNYPLERIEIGLTHEKIHAKDCADCESKEGKIDKIDVKIKFTGSLSDDQKKILLDVSQKCPVHKTLTSEIKIYTDMLY